MTRFSKWVKPWFAAAWEFTRFKLGHKSWARHCAAGGAAAGALGGASALANGATLAVAASTAPGEGLIVYMGETLGDELLTPDDEDSGGGNGSGPTCNN